MKLGEMLELNDNVTYVEIVGRGYLTSLKPTKYADAVAYLRGRHEWDVTPRKFILDEVSHTNRETILKVIM